MLIRRSIFIALVLWAFFPASIGAVALAPNQDTWLTKHNKTILVRPQKNYPPFSFSSSSPTSTPKGLAVDYLDLVAKKVGAHATYMEAKAGGAVLADLQAGKEGVALAVSEGDETAKYLYFSEPFVTLPAVIVTRKDFKKGTLTLADFTAKQIAITSGDAAQEYVQANYPKIIIDAVSDDEVALQKLLLGEVDAAVMDLASLSYYTSHDVLSYVRVAGQTGFQYKLSFAVPKTMPDLAVILNAGLKEITPAERTLIQDRWITFSSKEEDVIPQPFLFLGTPVWAAVSIVAVIIIAILLTLMVVHTRRHHRLQMASLSRAHEKEKNVSLLTHQLKELEGASSVLAENMEEIKSMEKEIQEKIQHIVD